MAVKELKHKPRHHPVVLWFKVCSRVFFPFFWFCSSWNCYQLVWKTIKKLLQHMILFKCKSIMKPGWEIYLFSFFMKSVYKKILQKHVKLNMWRWFDSVWHRLSCCRVHLETDEKKTKKKKQSLHQMRNFLTKRECDVEENQCVDLEKIEPFLSHDSFHTPGVGPCADSLVVLHVTR